MFKNYIVAAIAILIAAISCTDINKEEIQPELPLDNGLYIAGQATGYEKPIRACAMSKGVNAVTGARREGMYEKFIVLSADKDFWFMDIINDKQIRYSASLEEANSGSCTYYRGTIETETTNVMRVKDSGLYHVIFDLNRDGSLDGTGGPQIVLIPVKTFYVHGETDEEIFLAMSVGNLSNDGTSFSLETNFDSGGQFKFVYAKSDITLDSEGKLKVYANLGSDLKHPVPGGDYLQIQRGYNAISLEFKLTLGDVKNSFSAKMEYSFDVESKAEALKESVLNSNNTVDPTTVKGRCYYVSNGGKDYNDGLSPERPIKSLARVNNLQLNPGDVVLFKRGDTWRRENVDRVQMVLTKPGVTYSAYGSGKKPLFKGSPCDAAETGTWTLTDVPNVYKYSLYINIKTDVGGIFYDETDSAVKRISSKSSPFTWKDLSKDLDFFHEQDGYIYLCSTQGNPADRFKNIEITMFGHCFEAVENVTIDNLSIKFVGSHGIGSQFTDSLKVTNCEIAWIGGCYTNTTSDEPLRYGNGIELYGGCKKFVIDNCWVYECYDTGITHQFSSWESKPCVMENVTFSRNLIDRCTWSIEYFLHTRGGVERMMRNILYEGNICRDAGYGWGKQRIAYDGPARHVITWKTTDNPSENFVIRNNVFYRSVNSIYQIHALRTEWLPEMINNVVIE